MKIKNMLLACMFTAMTAVCAFVSIPIGPVPITLQNFVSVLSGIILGPIYGMLSQLLYMLIGLLGIPVFASGTSGFSRILSPSFGYIIGFILCPIVTGKIIGSSKNPTFFKILVASLGGILSIYIIGVPYMYLILHYVSHTYLAPFAVLKLGFILFIPGDIVKCIFASVFGSKLLPILKKYKTV